MKALPVVLVCLMLMIPIASAENADSQTSIGRVFDGLLTFIHKAFSTSNPNEIIVRENALQYANNRFTVLEIPHSQNEDVKQEVLNEESARDLVKRQLKLDSNEVRRIKNNGKETFIVTGGKNDEQGSTEFEAEIDPETSTIKSFKSRTKMSSKPSRRASSNYEISIASGLSGSALNEYSNEFPIQLDDFEVIQKIKNWSNIEIINNTNEICIQAITEARNPETGECKEFPTLCDVPEGWIRGCNDNLPRTFNSEEELISFIRNNTLGFKYSNILPLASIQEDTGYSTTNIQVEGVDESDIVKNDGKYIYTISGNRLTITEAYPPENARIISQTELPGVANNIFLNNNRIVVFGQNYQNIEYGFREMPWRSVQNSYIRIYDIQDRSNPELKREITLNGYYVNSRMIGDYVYSINNFYAWAEPLALPTISDNGDEKKVSAEEIYYFRYPDYGFNFVNILSINVQNDDEDYSSQTFLSGTSNNIYASKSNIYLTHSLWQPKILPSDQIPISRPEIVPPPSTQTSTVINKISINEGKMGFAGSNHAAGFALNQFSMDENNGFFRIATTTDTNENNLYVFDSEMNLAGKITDIATGERIYSVRFMGNKAYMVTFKNTDPLFAIDLENPYQPKILGELKIPGFSNYIHPYDENMIIGIGKDAIDSADFGWYQGVKLALFDVSDPENPKELAKYNIGDRGTDSFALHDHKAFLFDKEKKLLAIPITLAEIDQSKYPDGVPPFAFGDFTWQGAYVFSLDKQNGFNLKGRITHSDDNFYSNHIKRTLYIGDMLYTLSDKMIKINDLNNLQEINRVQFDEIFKEENDSIILETQKGYIMGKVTIGPLCPVEIVSCPNIPIPLCEGNLISIIGEDGCVTAYDCQPEACIQVITPARNPETGECRNFPTPCDVPNGWIKTEPCRTNEEFLISWARIGCEQETTYAKNPQTGDCMKFASPCEVPKGWEKRTSCKNSCGDESLAYSNRRIVIYQNDIVISELSLNETHEYSSELEPGIYIVDVTDFEGRIIPLEESRMMPGNAIPQEITIKEGEKTILDFDIDTGMR